MLYEKELNAVLQEIITRWGIPGLGIGIVEGNEIIYARGFGVQSLDSGAPVTLDSIFCVASIAKCFVATAVVQLAEQGKSTWMRPLSNTCPISSWTMNATGRSPSGRCSATLPACPT